MKLNKTLYYLPLLVLAGCGSSEMAEQAGGTTGSAGTTATSENASNDVGPRKDNEIGNAVTKRAVIRNATLQVRVANAEEAEKKVNRYVAATGGFVESSESSDLAAQSPTIALNLRVPSAKFDEAITTFEALGTRLAKKVSGEDVTAKIVDFDARMGIMKAQESSLRNALAKSTYSSNTVELETRLMNLRSDIESLTAQRKSLSDLATLSTVGLTLVGEAKGMADVNEKGWVNESWNSATSTLGVAGRIAATFGIFVVVLAPIWIPLAFLARRALKRERVSVPPRIA